MSTSRRVGSDKRSSITVPSMPVNQNAPLLTSAAITSSSSSSHSAQSFIAGYGSTHFSHLPTPHSSSPGTDGPYPASALPGPESPLAAAAQRRMNNASQPVHLGTPFNHKMSETTLPSQSIMGGMMTPESSPYAPRTQSSNMGTSQITTLPHEPMNFDQPPSTPKSSTSTLPMDVDPATPAASGGDHSPSLLSSPFVHKPSESSSRQPTPKSASPPTPLLASSDDAFMQLSRAAAAQFPAGGELERIRQARQMAAEDALRQQQEAETRRPEYLKRHKRTLAEADPSAFDDDRVGIFDSPHKGRRITLFQETSEESFEESLMAGGYGRYRTAEWVRQPQPIVVPPPKPVTPPTMEQAQQAAALNEPPSEKELTKRKRLAAFRGDATPWGPISKLAIVDLPVRGRCIVDNATAEAANMALKRAPPNAAKKGKKKEVAPQIAKRSSASGGPGDGVMDANWPDAVFPWNVRAKESAEEAQFAEAERFAALEAFFDRDSDDEDSDSESDEESEEELMPPTQVGQIYGDDEDRPLPARRGRGKMIGLPSNPIDRSTRVKRKQKYMSMFPSDPADARAALMAKKNARQLQYTRKRSKNESGDKDEVLCVCGVEIDDSQLVQCDSCDTWYHMRCVGINDPSELGEEDDLWYCEACAANYGPERSRDVSPVSEFHDLAPVPTFVENDGRPKAIPPSTTLFQQLAPPSPMPAWLPRKEVPERERLQPLDPNSLDIPWSSAPRTPGRTSNLSSARYDGIELPKTPSRNKQAYYSPALFQTPKNSGMLRVPGSAQQVLGTPRAKKSLGAAGSLAAVLEDNAYRTFSPMGITSRHSTGFLEDSPARRNSRPSLLSNTPRFIGNMPFGYESPIARSKGKDRAYDSDYLR
ncbi:hypothetical protein DL96DRAFT_1824231 [Flagelloscypha sp. PMI_526]|nr:hypothetical protein DL96DRAFT_1824231 [Flagelloscypha sp. PMI_526]